MSSAPAKTYSLRRILVVKLAGIGDLLTITPALRALRCSFPEAHIAALVSPDSADVLRDSQLVDELIVFDKTKFDRVSGAANPLSFGNALRLCARLRRSGYDAIFIMHHLVTLWGTLKYASLALTSGARHRVGLDNGRGIFLTERAQDGGFGHRHEVDYWLAVASALGASTADRRLEVELLPEHEAAARALLATLGRIGPIVAIHPGSGSYSLLRRWSPQRFATVADELASRHAAQIVLVGGPDEVGLAEEVAGAMRTGALNVAGKTSIKELTALLSHCDLFIGNDSGVMHLAVAAGTRVVAVFGPSNHHAWGPYFPRSLPSSTGAASSEVASHCRPGLGEAVPQCSRSDDIGARGRSDQASPVGLVVRIDLPCSPCLYRNPSVGRRKRCSDAQCLDQITPKMVLDAAEQLLDTR